MTATFDLALEVKGQIPTWKTLLGQNLVKIILLVFWLHQERSGATKLDMLLRC